MTQRVMCITEPCQQPDRPGSPETPLSVDDIRRELDLVRRVLGHLNARLAHFEQAEAEDTRQWRLLMQTPH